MAEVHRSSNGHVGSATEPETPYYMAAQPKKSKQYSALASMLRHGEPTRIEATFDNLKKMTWQQRLAMVFVAILWRVAKYLKLLGFVIEWTLNLLMLNNGPFGYLYKVFLFKWGESQANYFRVPCLKISETRCCFLCAEFIASMEVCSSS